LLDRQDGVRRGRLTAALEAFGYGIIFALAVVGAITVLALLLPQSAPAEEVLGERSVSVPIASRTRTAGSAQPSPPSGNRELIAYINARLARYVRPSGNCPFGAEETLATYYNSGHRTATGARFNPMGMTAAHRTLPFGTQLYVTNPHTGRSVTVTINDRGPFTHAKIDLAEGAARAIGMTTSIYVCISHFGFASAETPR
jgi:rare lipoprotein A